MNDGGQAQPDDGDAPSRTFQKVEYGSFESALREIGVTGDVLCAQIGYSAAAWVDWKRLGKMPKSAALACECLRRRQVGTGEDKTWLIKTKTKTEAAALDALCRGLGVEAMSLRPSPAPPPSK